MYRGNFTFYLICNKLIANHNCHRPDCLKPRRGSQWLHIRNNTKSTDTGEDSYIKILTNLWKFSNDTWLPHVLKITSVWWSLTQTRKFLEVFTASVKTSTAVLLHHIRHLSPCYVITNTRPYATLHISDSTRATCNIFVTQKNMTRKQGNLLHITHQYFL